MSTYSNHCIFDIFILDPTYFDGRCADIILEPDNKIIGRLGILHPDVIRNFELTMPCSALDLDLEVFL